MRSNVKLVQDSRDEHFYLHFGAVTEFPLESNFGDGIIWDIEKPGEVDCTAESGGKACSSQTKVPYDHEFLWNNTPSSGGGADPRDSMGAIVKFGMKPLDATKPIDKFWVSYTRGDTGDMDAFDNVRSVMLMARSSITVASYWYDEWQKTQRGGIMPVGVNKVSSHDWVVVDWKQINGIPMFKIDAHIGYPLYMPRDVFNEAMKPYGVGAYMPSTTNIERAVELSIISKLGDYIVNLWLGFQRQWLLKKEISVTPPTPITPVTLPTPKMTLGQIATSWIGKDASPKNLAPQELSCAEGCSNIINQYDPTFPAEVVGTPELKLALMNSKIFRGTLTPSVNCVIVSPTEGTNIGHTGIFVTDKDIVSNSSATGTMQQNYTFDSWIQKFKVEKHLHIYLFKIV